MVTYGEMRPKVRAFVDKEMERTPELFPPEMIARGYHLTGFLTESKKLPGVRLYLTGKMPISPVMLI